MLSILNVNYEECKSGLEAVEKYQSGQQYDIIFMDIFMPEMDGIQATKMIMDICRRKNDGIPIIVACTADSSEQVAKDCQMASIRYFLFKPVTMQKVKRYLQMANELRTNNA
jgi:CheY-like chemotaxis protein